MMMSAPARAIEVSDSIMTRGSSIQPLRGGGLDHRILAAHLVRGGRVAERVLHAAHDVEIGHRRLHHHDVCAFFDVLLDFAQRLFGVGGIHLVRPAIAELRRRIRRVAERAVERGTVLRGVRHDRDVLEAAVVQRLAYGADAAIHHVGGRDDVRAGDGLRDSCADELLDSRVVRDIVAFEHPAVTVRRVFA